MGKNDGIAHQVRGEKSGFLESYIRNRSETGTRQGIVWTFGQVLELDQVLMSELFWPLIYDARHIARRDNVQSSEKTDFVRNRMCSTITLDKPTGNSSRGQKTTFRTCCNSLNHELLVFLK